LVERSDHWRLTLMPLFSTCLTSFERPEMLVNAIESVRKNTFEDWQLIIGDSTKDSIKRQRIYEICREYEANDKRIIFKQYRAWSAKEDEQKSNYAWKNNQMFKLAEGEWITYMNDDDLYSSDYYQAYVNIMKVMPSASVIYTGQKAFKVDETGKENHELVYMLPAFDIKKCGFFCVDQNCVAHKREVFNEVGGWVDDVSVNNYADAEFWYKIALKKHLMYPTGKYTSIKSIHAGAISQKAQAENTKEQAA
jgi:spore maturation protein CgeD